jgi:hypothetical protein
MIKLTFKHRGYNRVVEFKEETYQSIYYQLGEMLNRGEPTFEEDRFIEDKIDYEKYQELMDKDFDEAMDYWEEVKETITEENYRDFIASLLEGNNYRSYDLINY